MMRTGMSIRAKGLLVAFTIVIGVAAAGYAAAPWLLSVVAVRALQGVVDVGELEVTDVGLSRIEIAAVRASNERIRLVAQDATVRYDPWPFRVRGVDIRKAAVMITGGPGSRGAGEAEAAPVAPLFPVHVEEMSLRLATPWGEVALPVSLDAAPGGAGGLAVEIHSKGFSAILTNPGNERHVLDLYDGGETAFLSVHARTGGGFPADFDATLNPDRLTDWLQEGDILPPALRPYLAPYSVGGSALEVTGTVKRSLDFTAEIRGEVTVRDKREPEARVFESVGLTAAQGYRIARTGGTWSGSGDAGFSFSPDPETTLTGRGLNWSWNAGDLSVAASTAELMPAALQADVVEASASTADMQRASGRLRAEGLRFAGWPEAFTFYDVQGQWTWQDGSLDADGSGDGAGLPQVSWRLALSGAAGHIDIEVNDSMTAVEAGLEVYTAVVAPDLELLGGQLEGRYRSEWDAQGRRTTLRLDAGSIDADLGEMKIRGLAVHAANLDNDIAHFDVRVAAPRLKLAAGTVAEDLELDLRLAPPEVSVTTARTRLFGGDISVRPVSFSIDDDQVVLFADIDALSLEQVMALLEMETTRLTGEVSGPVRIVLDTERGVAVDKADLHSVQAGVLQLRLGEGSAMGAQLNNIALRALEDFQYDELNASVLYRPDGEYRITARILGSNPQVLDGHPIALNPTIEGRLPALFRAFFITGDFSRAIIQRLQEEQNLSTPGETSTLQDD